MSIDGFVLQVLGIAGLSLTVRFMSKWSGDWEKKMACSFGCRRPT